MFEALFFAQQTADELKAEVHLPADLPILLDGPQIFTPPSLAEPPVVEFPDAAAGAAQGLVAMACIVTDTGVARKCIVEREEPAGMGFGSEALAAAPTFRFNPRQLNGMPLEGVVAFRLTVLAPQEQDSGSEPTPGATPQNWTQGFGYVRPPKPSHWPSSARGDTGSAKLRCLVGNSGVLENCTILSETPTNEGFGQAAVRAFIGSQLRLVENGPAVGDTIEPTMKFNLR